jgi:ABC-2 type transport system ATP-binding protein
MNDVVVTEQLCKRSGKVHALTDVSMRVPRGALFGLLGANGAGKTTLLDLLLNLQESSAGTAHVLGIESRKLRGPDFTRIGYVSESQRGPRDMKLGYFFNYLKPF